MPGACSRLSLCTIAGHRATYTRYALFLFIIDIIDSCAYYTDQYYNYDDISNYTTYDISQLQTIAKAFPVFLQTLQTFMHKTYF